jgi:hypothetical protein
MNIIYSCYSIQNQCNISLFEKINLFEILVSSLIKESVLKKHLKYWEETKKVLDFDLYSDDNSVFRNSITTTDNKFLIVIPFELQEKKKYMVRYVITIKIDKRTITSSEGHFFIDSEMLEQFLKSNLTLNVERVAESESDESDKEEDSEDTPEGDEEAEVGEQCEECENFICLCKDKE